MIDLLLLSYALADDPQIELHTGIWAHKTTTEWRNLAFYKAKTKAWKTSLLFTHRLWGDGIQQVDIRPLEIRWKGKKSNVTFEVGSLVPRWGQLDALSVIDIIGGKDLQFGPTTTAETSRMGTLGIQLSRKLGPWKWKALLLPFSPQNNIQTIGANWALLTPEEAISLTEDAATWSGDLLTESFFQQTLSSIASGLSSASLVQLSDALSKPSPEIRFGDLGGMLQWSSIGLTTNLYGGWLLDRSPAIQISPELADYLQSETLPSLTDQTEFQQALTDPFEMIRPRFWTLGMDVSTLLGPFGVRAEGAYRSIQTVQTPYLQHRTSPWWGLAGAIDWNYDSSIVTVIEVNYQKYTKVNTQTWLEPSEGLSIVGNLAGNAAQMKLNWSLQGMYIVPNQDFLFSMQMGWRLSSHWLIQSKALILGGQPKSDLLSYEGGFLGYWGQQDTISFNLIWNA